MSGGLCQKGEDSCVKDPSAPLKGTSQTWHVEDIPWIPTESHFLGTCEKVLLNVCTDNAKVDTARIFTVFVKAI